MKNVSEISLKTSANQVLSQQCQRTIKTFARFRLNREDVGEDNSVTSSANVKTNLFSSYFYVNAQKWRKKLKK